MGNILKSRSSLNELENAVAGSESHHSDPSLIVRKKLLSNHSYKSKLSHSDPSHLTHISQILADPQRLKETYLSTEWVRTEEIWREARGIWEERRDEMRRKIEGMRKQANTAQHGSPQSQLWTTPDFHDTVEENHNMHENFSFKEKQNENTLREAPERTSASTTLLPPAPSRVSTTTTTTTTTTNETAPSSDDEDDNQTIERYMQLFKLTQLPKVVSVKLIISEAMPSTSRQTLREIMSPVLSTLHVQPEYGLYHCGLCVAAWILEWNSSGLCIPRKVVSSAALMSIDIDRWSNTDLQSAVDKMAEVIVRWNTTMKYTNGVGRRSSSKKHVGNCQDFVDDMLQALNIRVDFQGALKEFLNDLRTKGKSELKFKITPTFRETFDLDEHVSEIIFKTHSQLDEFVHRIKSHKASFKLELDFHDESYLLKSYDRAFWMKNFKYEDDERWKPSEKCSCPFKDPRQTKSVLLFGQ
eukprot:CAMPEP_0117441756 /NCGR_PEP_ID=MMETSP0759-20121206/3797_1 /TAXON_ID=63605 /ORGANISM="Percolomonas cosmopolitus, Strain WS" /LENGTH=469 /DNA_ID=CAMNT_0005233617 /DNA_START=192 /DNA_END=1601 /DNA_ORIENTATION=+